MKPNRQHTLKIGTELDPETSGNLHILMWLSAEENYIELCRRKNFKTLGSKKYGKIISIYQQLNNA